MSKKNLRAPVSERALLQRINRKLQPDEKVKKVRVQKWRQQLGDFYCIDTQRNVVTAQHIDLEKYGRELGVLAGWEELSD